MFKVLRIVLRIAIFTAVAFPLVRPSWWIMEKFWTRDVSGKTASENQPFPVLVRRSDRGSRFAIDSYPEMKPESRLVTQFSEQELGQINHDLRALIGAENSNSEYFKILKRGPEYVDVSLDAVNGEDFWLKVSYRMENGIPRLQRSMYFNPVFGLTLWILPTLAGIAATKAARPILRRIGSKSDRVEQGLPTSR